METTYKTNTGSKVKVSLIDGKFSIDITTKTGLKLSVDSVTLKENVFCGNTTINSKSTNLKISTTLEAIKILNTYRDQIQSDYNSRDIINKEYKEHYNKIITAME